MTRTRHGATLAELLITLGVILTLTVIGLPVFTGIQNAVRDNDATSTLDRAEFSQRAWLATNATWASDPTALPAVRGITYTTAASNQATDASIDVSTTNTLGLAVLSDTGTCHARKIADPVTSGTVTNGTLPAGTACSGQAANANL